ncbi:AAA family ATPase [Alteromonas sp. 1_MG-2023]|uniref:ExeA family protein n=1 Tax=Alteromonas sp. 1_MG-2023 TaxID=3062669 RepID=UPI0026E2A656|nr:AAA family ATPase [Alteromonas sp. 1_MG-2023]MDO6566689.1 AAA family ATPase [Alteromonas sp. 1_MG-2023]
MYQDFFDFTEMPFSLTPNTEFFCALAPHNEALKVILSALSMSEGFIKVTGEVGTGKTLLCRKLINHLSDKFVACYLPNPYLSPDELRLSFAKELGIKLDTETERPNLHNAIEAQLLTLKREGKQAVLIIDEAQSLSWDALEMLRLFSNLETEKSKLLQIVLFGQPELDQNLAHKKVRQIRQRISFSYTLRSMTSSEVTYYIGHRLMTAGGEKSIIPNSLCTFISMVTQGTPRLVNIMCHKMLLHAYGQGKARVNWQHALNATLDTEDCKRRVVPRQSIIMFSMFAIVLIGLVELVPWGSV